MKKRLPIIVIILIIAAALTSVRVKRMKEKNGAPLLKPIPMAVHAVPVNSQTVSSGRHVLGEVLGADEADVAPRILAPVVEMRVREGDTVTAGQILAVLDGREQRETVDAAREGQEAARIAAEAQRDATARDKILYEAKAISQEQWDRSRALAAAVDARLAAEQKDLKVAETRLSYTEVTAPVSGVVAKRLVDPGDLAVPGKPVLEIVRQNDVRVRAKLPQEDMATLRVGQPVTLTAGDDEITAPVSRIFPSTDRNHLVTFEVDLDDPPASFVAGATVGMDITFTAAEGLAVPVAALLEGESSDWVFKISGEKIQPVAVKVRSAGSETVAVDGDLSVGDLVVVARPSRLMMLSEGQTVQPDRQGGQQ
jgi:RND family efflux transporter MFP subunit